MPKKALVVSLTGFFVLASVYFASQSQEIPASDLVAMPPVETLSDREVNPQTVVDASKKEGAVSQEKRYEEALMVRSLSRDSNLEQMRTFLRRGGFDKISSLELRKEFLRNALEHFDPTVREQARRIWKKRLEIAGRSEVLSQLDLLSEVIDVADMQRTLISLCRFVRVSDFYTEHLKQRLFELTGNDLILAELCGHT